MKYFIFAIAVFLSIRSVLLTQNKDNNVFFEDFGSLNIDKHWKLETRQEGNRIMSGLEHETLTDGKVIRLTFKGDTSLKSFDSQGPACCASEIMTRENCHYGDYSICFKIDSCDVGEGVVFAFFTYFNDGQDHNNDSIIDNHEIDMEILGADPHNIWMTIWTQYSAEPLEFRKVSRSVNPVTGERKQTPPGKENTYNVELIPPLDETWPEFDPVSQFYVYRFIWDKSSIRFFVEDGDKKLELWNYNNRSFIPEIPGNLRSNIWHNGTHWHMEGTADYPDRDKNFLIDWIKYTPFY